MSMTDPMTGLRVPTSFLTPPPVSPVSPLSAQLLGAVQNPTTIGSAAVAAAGRGAPVAATAGRTGFTSRAASSLLGRLPTLASAESATGLSRLLPAGMGLKAAGMRLGGGAIAGALGSNLVDRLDIGGNQSNWEQGLQGAAQGAGIGAVAGNLIPIPGVGAAVGAGVGAVAGGAIGVLANMFGGDDKAEEVNPVEVLANAIQQAGLDPTATAEILDIYDVQIALAESAPEGEERDALAAQALQQAGQMVLVAMQQREQATGAASNTLALQTQAADIFAPIASDIESSAISYADAMRNLTSQLPSGQAAGVNMGVARELNASSRLANAYRAQAAITPAVNQLTQYQQDFNSYAAQTFAQQMAQQAAGNSGATDLASLIPTG